MSGIRPLQRGDVPQVAALYERVMRSRTRVPPPGLGEYFERTFLDHPWADANIGSLVYEDDSGRLIGFIGSSARRLRFDGRPIRMACSGPLVADPDVGVQGVGVFLLRRYLAGPQDLTITDGATDLVARIWERLGGQTAHLSCIRWTRLFRPLRATADHFLAGSPGRSRLRRLARPVCAAVDALARLPASPFRPVARPKVVGESLTPDALLEHLPAFTRPLRLAPDYDGEFLTWLFHEMRAVKSRGTLTAAGVRDESRRLLGWYVYYLRRDGLCQVLQIVGKEGRVGEVIDHLFYSAQESGAPGLTGRLEPRLFAPLSERRCMLHRHRNLLALAHARDPAIVQAILSGQALLTRMEGETWFGHGTESFLT